MQESRDPSAEPPRGPVPSEWAPGPVRRVPWTPSLDFGAVFTRSFTISLQNILPFFLIAVVIFTPLIVLDVLGNPLLDLVLADEDLPETDEAVGDPLAEDDDEAGEDFEFDADDDGPSLMLLWLVAVPVGLFLHGLEFALPFVLQGAVAYGVFRQLRGSRASALQALAVGTRRLLPVLGLALVLVVLLTIGYVLLCIPGIILQCIFYVAVPAAVVEGVGVGGALRRSSNLTAGSRWQVFLLSLVIGLIGGAIGAVLGVALAPRLLLGEETMASTLAVRAVGILFAVWHAVAATVAYHDLRIAKEGVDIEDLAGVFD